MKTDSASIFGPESSGTCELPDKLTAQRYRAAWRCPCETVCVVRARRSSSPLWRRSPAVVGRDLSRRWIWRRGTTLWPLRSHDLTVVDFIPVRIPEGARLRSPSKDYRRSRGKISSSSDNGRYQQRKACARECWARHGHPSWNGQRPLRSHIVTMRRLWFCHLILRAICWWRVSYKLMPQDICCTVLSIFLTRIRPWTVCAQILFRPACIYVYVYTNVWNRCPCFSLNTTIGTNSGYISAFCEIFFVKFRVSLDISDQDSNTFYENIIVFCFTL
jgi:hypothetical protein